MKAGKRTKEWNEIRKELVIEFEDKGITTCEIKFAVCWRNNALGFAHLDKRRYLKGEQLRVVVLACNPCHQVIEKWPREQMRELLQDIIDAR